MQKKAILISEAATYLRRDGAKVTPGGGAAYFHGLALELVAKGYQVEVLCLGKGEWEVEGVKYRGLVDCGRTSVLLLWFLWRAIWKGRADLIYLNQFVPFLAVPFLRGRKVVVVHDVYGDFGFWQRQFGRFRGFVGWLVERIGLFFVRKFGDEVLTVSTASADKLRRFGIESELRPSVIERRHSGVKREDFVLFVGRFVGYKNPEHVLEVLKACEGMRGIFVVAAEFDDVVSRFWRKVGELKLNGRVEVKKRVSDGELRDLYAKARVLVHPSYVEGQGIVLLEALAMGTPVVAYNLAAYEGMEGLTLVAKGDVENLVQEVEKLLLSK